MTAETATQFAALGVKVPDQAIEKDDVFEIWDINVKALRLFVAMATQWRVATLATVERAVVRHLGLDYAALEAVMRLSGIRRKHRRRLFGQVRILEAAAVKAYGEVAR